MYFEETYFWQVSVSAALIICELLTRPHMILFSKEKQIYFPYMHSLYCYIFFINKHVLENIRFTGRMLMDFYFIISSHFTGMTAIKCELGQENQKAKMKVYIQVDLDRVPQGYFLYVL